MQMSQRFINKSIDEWRQRLQAVVQNNGAHIEHLRSYNFRHHWYDRSMSLVYKLTKQKSSANTEQRKKGIGKYSS